MEFSIATLLSQFTDDKLVARKVLEKKLECENDLTSKELEISLDALERIGVLSKEFGKYRRIVEDDVVEAKLRCSSKGFCFAIQDIEGADDVYVRESHLSNAWNGDRVLVRIIKEGSRRRSPEGAVKVILDRANPSLLATIKKVDYGYRAVPLDDRLLFEIDLKENDLEQLEGAIDHLVHVEVRRYPIGQHRPLGRVTKVLGSDAEAAADTDIVSCKHDLPQYFPQKALDEAEDLPKQVRKTDIKNRLDLRKAFTVTINGEDVLNAEESPFIESAITLEETEEGNFRLGIHVVDLAHYVESGSRLDKEARKRGTAVFLGKRIVPLFPDVVAQRLSLIPGKDRLTMSIFIDIDQAGEISEFEIQPSVICVDKQLTYKQVQSLLAQEEVMAQEEDLAGMLNHIFFNLSPKVRGVRQQRGAFELSFLDHELSYQDEGRTGVISLSDSLPVYSLLAELMVCANKAVADHLQTLDLPGIYCSQQEPDWDDLEDLLKLGNNLGLGLTLNAEDKVTSSDYQGFTQEFTRSSVAKVLNYLLESTLKSVNYTHKPMSHFGLAYEDGYTRMVSPGKRYGDLLVQRVLHVLFDEGRDRRNNRSKEGVNLGSSNCHEQVKWKVLPPQVHSDLEEELVALLPCLNDREKIAEDAEDDLEGLKKAEQMKERTGQIFQGLITGVQSYGFFVEIEDLLVEGLVHVSSLKDDWYEYRSRHACLVGRKNRTAYRLGDHVEVQVKSVDYYRQQIDLVTVGGGSDASNEDWEDE